MVHLAIADGAYAAQTEGGTGGVHRTPQEQTNFTPTFYERHAVDIVTAPIPIGAGLKAAKLAYTGIKAAHTSKAVRGAGSALDDATTGILKTVCKLTPGNSFTGATVVLMADGSKKPIEDVQLGDMVLADDPITGVQGDRPVVDLIRNSGLHIMVDVELSNGTKIEATDGHPFWVIQRKEWVNAIDLLEGDKVKTAEEQPLTVSHIQTKADDLTAYNLTIAGLHTYDVGEDEVLVHNDYVPPPSNKILRGFPDAEYIGDRGQRATWRVGKKTLLQWDYQHGAVEKYQNRVHQGQFDPDTGMEQKGPKKGRKPSGC